MATEFQFTLFEFGDVAGEGAFLVGHFRNHLQYNAALAARTNPVILPEFDIIEVTGGKVGRRAWLDSHAMWHNLLRPLANVTGIDLASVDLENKEQFYSWLESHNFEHQLLDIAFNIV